MIEGDPGRFRPTAPFRVYSVATVTDFGECERRGTADEPGGRSPGPRGADRDVHHVPGRSVRGGLHPSGAFRSRPPARALSNTFACSLLGWPRAEARSRASNAGAARVRVALARFGRSIARSLPTIVAAAASPPRDLARRRRPGVLARGADRVLTRPSFPPRTTHPSLTAARAGEGPDGGVEDGGGQGRAADIRKERQGLRVLHRRRAGAQDAAPEGRAPRTCVFARVPRTSSCVSVSRRSIRRARPAGTSNTSSPLPRIRPRRPAHLPPPLPPPFSSQWA